MTINKLAIRLKPFEDESLSSFIIRLAQANGIGILPFLNYLRLNQNRYSQKNEISLLDFSLIVNNKKMALISGIDEEILFEKTFHNVIERFTINNEKNRNRLLAGIIRTEYYHCVQCLNEKDYYRLLWRVDGINFCEKHQCNLQNKCSSCEKIIKIQDIEKFTSCPFCKKTIKEKNDNLINMLTKDEINKSNWLYKTWDILIRKSSQNFTPQELAFKFLYVLNSQENQINHDIIRSNLKSEIFLPVIFQQARDTLYQKRSFHISLLLRFLYEFHINLNDFIGLTPPKEFIDSILYKQFPLKERKYCLAPWCSNYLRAGSLEKTGTTFKRKSDGNVLKYYMFCKTCGCSYAINEHNQLIERTDFIQIYKSLTNTNYSDVSLTKLTQMTNYSAEKVRRAFAYFRTRNIMKDLDFYNEFVFHEKLLIDFINLIRRGHSIKEIKEILGVDNYHDFLTYRYHQNIILAELENKRDRNQEKREIPQVYKVINLLDYMLNQNIDISLKNVCKELNISAETIRNWGCNKTISEMKKIQKEKRLLELKQKWYEQIDNYIKSDDKRSPKDLYNMLGIQRTVLWRIAPEITAYISKAISNSDGM